MARLNCKCGAEMSNTHTPSKHEINVFYKSEAESAIKSNPKIRLWDFYTGWDELNNCHNTFQNRSEPVEYWFCTECKRVYEVQAVSCGRIVRTFVPQKAEIIRKADYSNLKELIVLTDLEMDELLSSNENETLGEYIDQDKPVRYFVTGDEKKVYVINDGQVACIYSLEK
ncbi:MAG: hypothetical protein K6F34_01880 [Lachnospiraceae bacterium]|nr:hypothetical protein [Lachnospiraceae bacterium]